jgi:steroid delta-isomerase-like uncharacterized protein
MNVVDILSRLEDTTNRHDADGVLAFYASDVVRHDPSDGRPLRSKRELKEHSERFWAAFPDLRIHFLQVLTSGSLVAAELVVTGTHLAPLKTEGGSIPATHRAFDVRAVRFMRLNPEGLIMEERRYFDTGDFWRQLGVTPP